MQFRVSFIIKVGTIFSRAPSLLKDKLLKNKPSGLYSSQHHTKPPIKKPYEISNFRMVGISTAVPLLT
jgi:hypothetical protein